MLNALGNRNVETQEQRGKKEVAANEMKVGQEMAGQGKERSQTGRHKEGCKELCRKAA